ncbi:MAG: HAD-IB family phosphatase [SAR202 cluster bacterium]|nr:HAD-IB family phosphatase [SAR202 cluster bacterium]
MMILCDFDDTTAEQNVATPLLERYQPVTVAGMHWSEMRQRFRRSELSLKEYQEYTFEAMGASREAQAQFVRETARLREGFPEMVDYCVERGIGVSIVSHGLDFYVRALLQQAHLAHLPVFAVENGEDMHGRVTFAYRFGDPACDWYHGNCKCHVLEELRERGHQVIYAGDGLSDTCPARKADFVFARAGLLSFCRACNVPHRELTDFHAVVDYLRETEASR